MTRDPDAHDRCPIGGDTFPVADWAYTTPRPGLMPAPRNLASDLYAEPEPLTKPARTPTENTATHIARKQRIWEGMVVRCAETSTPLPKGFCFDGSYDGYEAVEYHDERGLDADDRRGPEYVAHFPVDGMGQAL